MEDKLEHLIQSIKEAKPMLKQPENLTDEIMEKIGKQSANQVAPLLIWARAVLSTAAVLLLGLFVFEHSEAENTMTTAFAKPILESTVESDSTCMQMLGSEHLSYIQTYLCYMQQNAIDNKLFKTYPQQKN